MMQQIATTQTPAATAARLPGRTVLVHDYLNQHGGAERLLEVMHDLAPEAPVFTSMYDPDSLPPTYRAWDIRTTWMNRLPGVTSSHQRYLPVYPLAFEQLRLPDCDLVLSSSSAFAKAVRPPIGAAHVAYIHSPMRFAWNLDGYVERERIKPAMRGALRPLMAAMRSWDRRTVDRVDRFAANSTAVRDRIRSFWDRDSTVIFPPVDVERFVPAPRDEVGDYFLMVSRLVPYKRFDLAIEAFNALGLPLWIVGDGRDREALSRQAGETVQLLGRVDDADLAGLYARARAVVFMSEDDFGIAQVEAQAAGRPVIALGAGGALDTVVDGGTGVHVTEQTADSLIEAIRRFERLTFSVDRNVAHAQQFSKERFSRELVALVDETQEGLRAGRSQLWN
ncbi:MAG TPA: glycosyltransferase [Thermomicrobiales bacterium]|nr:glycosyltransferase [Thermomicrobiales bacterium]HRA31276.1 glycosyltransferase [Thermomicrobiales bacterium]